MTHSYRYFRLWLPSAEVEVAETNRYKAHTQKSELCVRARRDIAAGEWIIPLEGALARLDASQEGALTNSRKAGYGLRRDFSVVQVYGFPHGMLFLGPARFVNVSSLPAFAPHLSNKLRIGHARPSCSTIVIPIAN
jgi:hypothetical protein